METRDENQRSSIRKPGREVQNQDKEVKLNHHNLEISNIRCTENVFANVRQELNRPEDDQIVFMDISKFSSSHFCSISYIRTMSKRLMQEENNRIR